jgi:ATP-binding cassette, subfamily B, bacterial PglK
MADRKSRRFQSSIAQLWMLVDAHRRREVLKLVALIVAGALTEAVTIGSVVPFIALLATGSAGPHARWIEPAFSALGASTRQRELLLATALLCLAAVGSAVLRLLLVRKTRDFACGFGHQLSVELQRRMFLQPYAWHVQHNSSEQLAAIEKAEGVTNVVVLPLVQSFAAAILILFVLALLLAIAPFATIMAAVALGGIYYALGAFARKRLDDYSDLMDEAFARRIRIVQEGLGGIRELILDGAQTKVIDQFRAVDWQLAQARANASFIASVPRFLIEPAGVITIAGVALLLSQRAGGLVEALPILGALALGAQRLLPLAQQLYHGWSGVAGNSAVIDDVVRQLSLRVPPPAAPVAALPFARNIEFRDVSFTYADRPGAAVEGLSFDIRRGSRVALLGPTGSGKTTTADLLMALLQPTRGSILVDGAPLTDATLQSWRANVGHVPQMLFLADATVAQNIAMADSVDMDRVASAVAAARLEELVAALPNGLETRVGERGVQISGGQRQRLAIARAIYKETPLLVLDEATSALDPATEAAVLGALDRLQDEGRTIVIIAHRPTTTELCDHVLRLEQGRLVENSPARGRSRPGGSAAPLRRR